MKRRMIDIYTQGEEGALMVISIYVNEHGWVGSSNTKVRSKQQSSTGYKYKIRYRDRIWIYHNIPGSIWWNNEIHHDWNDGGRMYILSSEKHREISKKERREKKCEK